MNWFKEWLDSLEEDAPDLSAEWIDAGFVPLGFDPKRFSWVDIPEEELIRAYFEDLVNYRELETYTNQSVEITYDPIRRTTRVKYRFHTPCITSLE